MEAPIKKDRIEKGQPINGIKPNIQDNRKKIDENQKVCICQRKWESSHFEGERILAK
jgi:hypothetical protein